MLIHYRPMAPHELERIGEVDRAELVTGAYLVEATGPLTLTARLISYEPPHQSSPWSSADIADRIQSWRKPLEQGGHMIGAFAGDQLAGFAILGPLRPDNSAEIVALFVDNGYRRQGLGAELLRRTTAIARDGGAAALFLASNRTVAAAHFYQKHGFTIVGLSAKQIVPSLSGDILMAKRIQGRRATTVVRN